MTLLSIGSMLRKPRSSLRRERVSGDIAAAAALWGRADVLKRAHVGESSPKAGNSAWVPTQLSLVESTDILSS